MRKIMMLMLAVAMATASHAQYKPVEQGSTLKFTIKNVGFGVDGSFGGFEGSINFDPQNTAGSSFDVNINAATVNTDNSLRDEHLRGDSYFDVKNNPKIRLVSSKITGKGSSFQFTGTLTIKGKSKVITFPFSAVGSTDSYVFKGEFKMNRKDFGIGGISTISDELQVIINVVAKKS